MSQISLEALKAATQQLLPSRRSVRAYTKEALSDTELENIFTVAQTAPSNCNTQPWQVHVASGDKIEALRSAMMEATMAGKMTMDFPYEAKYQDLYQDRQYDAAIKAHEKS